MDLTLVSIIVAIFAVLLVGLWWYFKSSSDVISSRYNRVVLYGPCGSGKTLLFFQLLHGRNQETQSSMQENVLSFVPKQPAVSKQYEFVDLSGHPSQAYRIKKYCSNIKYVLFMIDATDLKNINNSSKMLYQLLSLKAFDSLSPKPKLLVIGNKTDQPNATTMISIKSTLMKELNKLYESNSSLSSLDEKDNQVIDILKTDTQTSTSFGWEDIKHDITFTSCSVLEKDIDTILTFLK
eukprot:517304_1